MKARNSNPIIGIIVIILAVASILYFMTPRQSPDLELAVVGTPNVDIRPVPDFNLTRYMGTWYELARYDHSYERGCSCVTAKYVLLADYVEVSNSCVRDGKMSSISGKAYTTTTPGVLMVQFFPTTKSDYRVIFVDNNYQNAIVTNKEMSQLWFLSRTQDPAYLAAMTEIAKQRGLDTSKLITVGGCVGQ